MPEETPEGGAGTALAEERLFTQDEVDRIVTERLRRERQRAEKAVRDEYEGRIAELDAVTEAGHAAVAELSRTKTELYETRKQALVRDRLLARARQGVPGRRPGALLPPAYTAQIDGEDEAAVDAAIAAAEEQWAADLRAYGRPATDVGRPSNPGAGGANAQPQRVDADLAERMRQGDPEAYQQYVAVRGR